MVETYVVALTFLGLIVLAATVLPELLGGTPFLFLSRIWVSERSRFRFRSDYRTPTR
ncbi:hypothetical protein ACFFQF_15540 [Haladaptatus pallidirubidus]|uniref:hypothetical protein n=1 Tax=Haladaptatus pallidirubidus TaxID=1008152 RepID=UPI0035E7EDDE